MRYEYLLLRCEHSYRNNLIQTMNTKGKENGKPTMQYQPQFDQKPVGKKTKDFAKSCRLGTKQVFRHTCEWLHINSDISHQGGQPR